MFPPPLRVTIKSVLFSIFGVFLENFCWKCFKAGCVGIKICIASSSSSSSSFPLLLPLLRSAPSTSLHRASRFDWHLFSLSIFHLARCDTSPALYTLSRADRLYVFIFRNMSFMSNMSWIFLPSSPPFAVLPPFLLSLTPSLSSPYTFSFPFSPLILLRSYDLSNDIVMIICSPFPPRIRYNYPFPPFSLLQL